MKITRVQVVQDGHALRIQFNDTSEVVAPTPRKVGFADTLHCVGTKLYVSGQFLMDAASFIDVGEVC